jgi:hypothetical protein
MQCTTLLYSPDGWWWCTGVLAGPDTASTIWGYTTRSGHFSLSFRHMREPLTIGLIKVRMSESWSVLYRYCYRCAQTVVWLVAFVGFLGLNLSSANTQSLWYVSHRVLYSDGCLAGWAPTDRCRTQNWWYDTATPINVSMYTIIRNGWLIVWGLLTRGSESVRLGHFVHFRLFWPRWVELLWLSAVYAARFANTSTSSACSDGRTPQTHRINCLGNLYRVSLYFDIEYEELRWLLDVPDKSLGASVGGRFTNFQ